MEDLGGAGVCGERKVLGVACCRHCCSAAAVVSTTQGCNEGSD
jgi:hypothetical protein